MGVSQGRARMLIQGIARGRELVQSQRSGRRRMIQCCEKLDATLMREVAQYLDQVPAATGVCGEHDPRWLHVLAQGLRHRPYALLARSAQGTLQGYLPLAFVGTRLFGRFLVSLPYLNRAGVVAGDAATAGELVDQACDLAGRLNAQYLELRHQAPLTSPRFNASRDEKVRMVLELPADAEALWKSFDAKVRNQIRKGDKHHLSIRWGGRELLPAFYDVFAQNMRDLGTPVYAPGLFHAILEHLPDRAELAVVDCTGQPVAAALLIHDPPTAGGVPSATQVPSASSLRQFNQTNANMWMYHQLLLRALGRGSREFDFGRSSVDSGTYKFKKQWGALPHPTVWQYHVRRGDIGAVRPDNPKYQRRIEVWKRLPLWLTRLVGPSIVRGIP